MKMEPLGAYMAAVAVGLPLEALLALVPKVLF
jgi:hypothetical protein